VFEVLLSLVLAMHLVCVNIASGGPIVAAWLDWRGARGDETAATGAKYLAAWSLAMLLAGAVLGVFVGWLKWDADYRALWLGPLSYKLKWAAIEAVFSLVLTAGWWWLLPGRPGGRRSAAIGRGVVALLSATNLLYHFPVLFVVAARLEEAGQVAGEPIGGAAFRPLMLQGETPALAVHVVLASIAVAGTVLLGLALRYQRQGNPEAAAKAAIWGGRWALVPTIAQLPVGLWTLSMLAPSTQTRLMGSDTLATLLFLASLAAAFWLVRELVAVAMGETSRAALMRSMVAMLVTVTLMTGMQQASRAPIKSSPVTAKAVHDA
jgi:hypothetical protein